MLGGRNKTSGDEQKAENAIGRSGPKVLEPFEFRRHPKVAQRR